MSKLRNPRVAVPLLLLLLVGIFPLITADSNYEEAVLIVAMIA